MPVLTTMGRSKRKSVRVPAVLAGKATATSGDVAVADPYLLMLTP